VLDSTAIRDCATPMKGTIGKSPDSIDPRE
jgi:hypothetical protein